MKKYFLPILIIAGNFLLPHTANADYFVVSNITSKQYKFVNFTIPANAGEDTGWWDENGSINVSIVGSDTHGSYLELSVNGTLLGDNLYATDNPGIGIRYKLSAASGGTDPADGSTASPNYRVTLSGTASAFVSYIHVKYQLVRLTDKVPAGHITSAPIVTLYVHNPDGIGEPLVSGIVYNGMVGSQPTMTACTIDAPTEIKLPVLYGSNIINGAQNVVDIPTIKLTNCPGAINGISYMFKASYGEHDAANGVIKAETGTGYARGVFVQLQNADSTGFNKFNNNIPLDYTGSGNYDIPNYKVGYYIDDGNSVTAGNVKSALEFDVNYN
ncbi:fimbrial protein [Citrobacter portucalensis]|uniref:fimbrial protein n=1 Tax=Citrobacter portucalensis TaxID=1639133 RepID=UPI0039F5BFBF